MSFNFRSLAVPAFALAIGCTDGGLDDNRFATGSQAMVAGSNYESLYVANAELNTVSYVDVKTGEYAEVEVGKEPTRIARANDRVFVTLRGERAVAVLLEKDGKLELETKIEVGAEPYGIVAQENGEKIYVVSSISRRIDEIDVEGLSILRSWETPAEIRWLALHPSNHTLYGASPYEAGLFWIPLREDGVIYKSEMPASSGFTGAFGGFGGSAATGTPMTPRNTGDVSVSPNGYEVVIPALYVDNITPIATDSPPPTGYYGQGRVNNPAVVVMPVDNHGEPMPEYVFALGVGNMVNSGYPASATVDPNSEAVYLTMEGSGGVTVTLLNEGSAGDETVLDKVFSGDGGVGGNARFASAKNGTGLVMGPRAIAFLGDDEAYTYGFLDFAVQDINAKTLRDRLDTAVVFDQEAINGGKQLKVAVSTLPDDVERGRRLFYRNDYANMSAAVAGLSCATCHFDGRNDSLTWTFTNGRLRQTPSLAGPVSQTEPVRWAGDRATVQEDILRTSADAMGGGNLSTQELNQVAAYVDYIPDVDIPVEELDPDAVERGRIIFSRPDVACASCHSGARYTNNESYEMFGMNSVQTRALVGLAASAPYLHDGSAATIRDVLERSRSGVMGNTSMLSDAEMDDLETFLKSL